jgi:hypothetical protein
MPTGFFITPGNFFSLTAPLSQRFKKKDLTAKNTVSLIKYEAGSGGLGRGYNGEHDKNF